MLVYALKYTTVPPRGAGGAAPAAHARGGAAPRGRAPAPRLAALLAPGRGAGPGPAGRRRLRRPGDRREGRGPVHHRRGRRTGGVLIVMRHGATDQEVQRVVRVIEEMGYQARPMPGTQRTAARPGG